MEPATIFIIIAIFLVAVLYSSVGHGGASGYLAVMAFFAVAPEVTRPTALVLNLFVASIGTYQFWRAGYFSWKLFWPFGVTSIPFAFLGGMIVLPTNIYKIVLGAVLCLAAVRLAIKLKNDDEVRQPPLIACLLIGAVIGLLSGMVGVGGGIFLTPILLLMHWAETRVAAGVSVLFILVNSIAGLAGNYKQVSVLPNDVWIWIAVAVVGGVIGSTLGSRKFDSITLRRVLACVLLFAGVKLILV
ncbi:MAG TPA: sulfite exporter TauE/SafE family protein [Pyrinomonadaceae bacterium]|nr:sulfite exporter TauE/SafE family protein [Pyrinomonadaceae bacterium]